MALRLAPQTLLVVGGPSGSGKSTSFPVAEFGIDSFNVDDYCASRNNDSYQGISQALREQGLAACAAAVREHLESKQSIAIEASLRRNQTFELVEEAHKAGFTSQLIYLANDNLDVNIERVKRRAQDGGHAAKPKHLRAIYRESLQNLPRALRLFHYAAVYDTTGHNRAPRAVFGTDHGKPVLEDKGPVRAPRIGTPRWLWEALEGTEYRSVLSPPR